MALNSLRLNRDALLTVTKAFPAAAANNNSPTIDLGVGPYRPDNMMVEISLPALALQTTSGKNLVLTLQDSADDITYASLSQPAITVTQPGVTSTGAVAVKIYFRLPPATRRYIQFLQAVDSGGDTLTASSATYSLLT